MKFNLSIGPFHITYYENEKLLHLNYCFVTDYLKHDVNAEYTFQKKITTDLKQSFPAFIKNSFLVIDAVSNIKISITFLTSANMKTLVLNVGGISLPLHMEEILVMELGEF